jgi:putative colanic acid biosynthesis UDP-glucose lipid carrier transferase
MFRWTHGLINRLVTLADVAALLIASLVHPGFAHGWLDGQIAPAGVAGGPDALTIVQSLLLAAIEAGVFVSVLRAASAYRVENYTRLPVSLGGVALGLVCAWIAGAGTIAAFAPALLQTPAWFAVHHLPQLALLVLLRVGVWGLVGQIDRLALMRRNTIVIGCGAEAEDMVRRLTDPAQARHYNVIGIVGDEDGAAPALLAGRPLLGGLPILASLAHHDAVDLVVIAIPLAQRAKLPRVIDALQWVSADVVLRLDATTAQSLIKLIEDRVIAAVALVLISPVLLLTALAIRLDSPGPALFRQDRIGLHNRTFRIFKFRTMTVDPTDDGSVGTTSRHNPRITRVGGVLRKLSIDELPQLLNVLIGDMSIVGPRPYVRNMKVEDETFDVAVRGFAARHRIKPGITGLAQASGFRSNALRNKRNAAISVQLDMDYIANWSLWLDLRIMVRTVMRGMSGPEVF